MNHPPLNPAFQERRPWNEGRPDRALFDFPTDSKLRGCGAVEVRIGDVVSDGRVRDRVIVVQQKTNGLFKSN